MIKAQQKLGIQGISLNIIKAIANIMLNRGKVKGFCLTSKVNPDCSLSPLSSSTVLKVSARAIRQEQGRKGMQVKQD